MAGPPEAFSQAEADLIGLAIKEYADKHGVPPLPADGVAALEDK